MTVDHCAESVQMSIINFVTLHLKNNNVMNSGYWENGIASSSVKILYIVDIK